MARGSGKVDQVQDQVDEVVVSMNDNVQKALERGENLDNLQAKTDQMKNSSAVFKKNTTEVKNRMWWKNMRMNFLIGFIVLIIVGVIVVACLKAFHII